MMRSKRGRRSDAVRITFFVAGLAFGLSRGGPPGGAAAADKTFTRSFSVSSSSEVIATIRAGCARCSWGEAGREAAALRLTVDGKYSQHIVLARGEAPAEYVVTLGAIRGGMHHVTIARDPRLSAAGAGPAVVERVDFRAIRADAVWKSFASYRRADDDTCRTVRRACTRID